MRFAWRVYSTRLRGWLAVTDVTGWAVEIWEMGVEIPIWMLVLAISEIAGVWEECGLASLDRTAEAAVST
jgi:hypothetical protein